MHARAPRSGWIHTAGALGAILIPVAILISFFTSADTGDTASELIAYAKANETEIWWLQVVGLATPLLTGLFVASLWSRLREAGDGFRALTLVGGTLFAAFLATAVTLWAAPLIDSEALTDAGAEAYLVFDDAGWVLLGLAGISAGVMIIGVSLAALEHGWLPSWAGWVSVLLGVVSLATIVAVGVFAWTLWLIAAGVYLLLEGRRTAAAVQPPEPVA